MFSHCEGGEGVVLIVIFGEREIEIVLFWIFVVKWNYGDVGMVFFYCFVHFFCILVVIVGDYCFVFVNFYEKIYESIGVVGFVFEIV